MHPPLPRFASEIVLSLPPGEAYFEEESPGVLKSAFLFV